MCRGTAKAAYNAGELPDAVIDILTSLRNYLQDKCEPPVYVSDRRFMKSVNLLQVAAHADGRDQVRGRSLVPPSTPVVSAHHLYFAQFHITCTLVIQWLTLQTGCEGMLLPKTSLNAPLQPFC